MSPFCEKLHQKYNRYRICTVHFFEGKIFKTESTVKIALICFYHQLLAQARDRSNGRVCGWKGAEIIQSAPTMLPLLCYYIYQLL